MDGEEETVCGAGKPGRGSVVESVAFSVVGASAGHLVRFSLQNVTTVTTTLTVGNSTATN
jgi:hypothetical protein